MRFCSYPLHLQPSRAHPSLVLLHEQRAVDAVPAGRVRLDSDSAPPALQFLIHALHVVRCPQALAVALGQVQDGQQRLQVLLHPRVWAARDRPPKHNKESHRSLGEAATPGSFHRENVLLHDAPGLRARGGAGAPAEPKDD